MAAFAGIGTLRAAPEGSGLPVPRFVTLKAAEANMRSGPGEQYPIRWTYRRPGLPLEVVAEFHHWRRVRDWQGAEGWMHHAMLSSKRTFIVVGEVRDLRGKPDAQAAAVARIQGQVTGKVLGCDKGADWCQVEVDGLKGWLRRGDMWGVYRDEEID